MILLHNKKGGISGQVLKNLQGEDIKLLADNLNKAEGTAWQVLIKFRDTRQSFPAVFGFALGIFDAFEKDPYFVELSESEAKGKLRAWGMTAVEVDTLINEKMEVS